MTSIALLRPQPRPEILAIDAYVPGKSRVAGVAKVHKLSSNESPLGASPKAIEAFRNCAGDLAVYPDGSASALREAIGSRFGLEPSRIICGNGSDELFALLAHAFLPPGDEGLYSEYGFLEYPICIRAAGGVPVIAKEVDNTANVDAMLARVSGRTKIVFLANPNNPTGTYLSFAEVKRLQAALAGRLPARHRRSIRRVRSTKRLRCGHRTRRDLRECCHDADFLQNPWPRQFANRLGLWTAARH